MLQTNLQLSKVIVFDYSIILSFFYFYFLICTLYIYVIFQHLTRFPMIYEMLKKAEESFPFNIIIQGFKI